MDIRAVKRQEYAPQRSKLIPNFQPIARKVADPFGANVASIIEP